MGKEEIISVQYHHKGRSISTLKKMLKAISENEHTMGVWCPAYLSAQDQGNAWRTKVRDNLSYSIQSCMQMNRSERQKASRSVDACYHK